MNISERIDEIAKFICENYGMYKKFLKDKDLYIHDNVFGTLKFKNFERKIINSPFLQRLTKINQMGLANFVYPGAVHNRFSHSLGVSYLAGKIYNEIMGDLEERDDNDKKRDINTVKLAGLLHDIGHGPFSHLTEDVIERLRFVSYRCKEIDDQIVIRSGFLGQTTTKLHEYLTYRLIESKPVSKMIENIYKDIPIHSDLISLCVTNNSLPEKDDKGKFSKKFDDKYKMLLIKIINGYSDADKIDYLLRDSKFSGLPIPADTDRLISFLTSIEDKDKKYYELGVLEKGTRAFNLLLQSRATMFPTVYHHHTTLACETMLVFAIVDAIRNVCVATAGIDKKKWPPIECGVDLLRYTDDKLLEYLRIINNPISNDVVLRLNNRRYYRVVRKFNTWDLINKLIKSEDEYREFLIKSKQYDEFQALLDEEKYIDHNEKLYLKYKREYEAKQEEKINNFIYGLNTPDKIRKFKKDIISKEPSIIKELEEKLPGVKKEMLIDYVIAIRFPKRRETSEPYKQPFIKRINPFTNIEELLTLRKMGYAAPRVIDYQHITFYALPEYVNKLQPHIDDYAKAIIPEFFDIS